MTGTLDQQAAAVPLRTIQRLDCLSWQRGDLGTAKACVHQRGNPSLWQDDADIEQHALALTAAEQHQGWLHCSTV
jgi:hypothetical protein